MSTHGSTLCGTVHAGAAQIAFLSGLREIGEICTMFAGEVGSLHGSRHRKGNPLSVYRTAQFHHNAIIRNLACGSHSKDRTYVVIFSVTQFLSVLLSDAHIFFRSRILGSVSALVTLLSP